MKFIKWLFSRIAIAGLLLLLQIFLFVYLLFINNKIGSYLYLGMDIISALIVLYLINKSYEPTQKLSWLVVVLVLPIVGPMLYLLFSSNSISKKYNRKKQERWSDA
jgi:cardiolipin synthase